MDKEKLNQKKKIPYLIIVLFAIVFLVIISFASYAFFTADIAGTGSNTIVTTGIMAIDYTDGPDISIYNVTPGTYIEKTFSVKNTGTVNTKYDIYLSELVNNFVDKSDLVYTLVSNDGGQNITQTQVPSSSAKIVANKEIAVGITHTYTLRITFKETNDNQDDNKDKEFSAMIRINEVRDATLVRKNAVEKIMELVDGADSTSIDVIGNTGLAYDGTVDNNLRYVGKNPNNYVQFNNELWRIIGVMNNIQTNTGQSKSLLKLRRSESIGQFSWDSSDSSINNGYGINQWGESGSYEGSDLMRELNTDYLSNVTVGNDDKWFDGDNNLKATNMPTNKIVNQAQLIENVVWNLGSIDNVDGEIDLDWASNINASTSYIRERANTNGKICSGKSSCNDTITRVNTWTGKIALFYVSDYGYATSGGLTTTRTTCLNTTLYLWNNDENTDCRKNNWLYNGSVSQWTMSPYADPSAANNSFRVSAAGLVTHNRASTAYDISPVLYLKSSVKITGGDGTPNNPYTLG